MSWGCALLILGFKGQRSRCQCIDSWKWLFVHNCFPFTPNIMKLHKKTSLELHMCPIDFRVKRSKLKVTILNSWKYSMSHNCFPFIHKYHKTSHKYAHWGFAILILGSKGQGHNALFTENGLWCKTAFPLHLQSSNFAQRSQWVQDMP